jgi:hypothetical protein
MQRRCTFCGSSDSLSREHLFPDWASEYFAKDGKLSHHRHAIADGQDAESPSSWQQKAFALTVRAVCASCNNGWMAELEADVKHSFFSDAFAGYGKSLDQHTQRALASWAMKTALMAEHTNGSIKRQIKHGEYEHLYLQHEPSQNVRIWMTAYVGRRIVATASRLGLDLNMAQDPDPLRGERDLWTATISVGPVAFQLLGSDIAGVIADFEPPLHLLRQIWPYRRDFTWSPRIGLDDNDLIALNDTFLDFFRSTSEPA